MAEQTEQEKRQEELAKKYEAGTLNQDEKGDEAKGRKKAAEQWYAHFDAVLTMIEEAPEDSPLDTKESVVAALIYSWDAKKSEADERMSSRLSKLRG